MADPDAFLLTPEGRQRLLATYRDGLLREPDVATPVPLPAGLPSDTRPA